ncbi:MAG: D-2-hydroxyacid dehydrogenase [Oscillospiraceae bacterium]|jgi:glycerate dehydrogenase|nr:D-2-hydroxyacid dehydrogenase [Oscillospiraceae bacterium]
MKIIVLDGYTLNPGDLSWAALEALGDVTIYEQTPPDEIIARIGDAPVVITNKTVLTAETFAACPALRYVGVLATGYNVVDVAAAAARGICVTNIPSYGTAAVAQYTFALLLELCLHVGAHDSAIRAGEWGRNGAFCFWHGSLIEIEGMTMGLIGLGRIGRRVAAVAQAFGLNVLAYDPSAGEAPEGVALVSLETLLAASDIVSLHCPLTADNQGMINQQTINQMKQGAMLINTARGGLLNEADVAEALADGRLSGAAVDVLSTEPPKADNPMLTAPNCIITPHIAWAPLATRKRLLSIAIENVRCYLAGEAVNRVN